LLDTREKRTKKEKLKNWQTVQAQTEEQKSPLILDKSKQFFPISYSWLKREAEKLSQKTTKSQTTADAA